MVDAPQFELLTVRGDDGEALLQRMLTNDLRQANANRAVPAFLLAPTGRIVSGAVFVRDAAGMTAICPQGWAEPLAAGLRRYVLRERVEIAADARPARYISWPRAAPEPPWTIARGSSGYGVRIPLTGEDEMVWVGDDAPPSDTASGFTARRIAAGTPWFGTELRTDTIPVEAAVWDWLSNRKGCYVGQEVVERMWSRNRTARRLCTFALADSALPEAPVEVAGNGGKGQITSIAAHPQRGVIGLGWWTGELVDAQAIDPEGRVWAIQERARDERLVS